VKQKFDLAEKRLKMTKHRSSNNKTDPKSIVIAAVEGGGTTFKVAVCRLVGRNNTREILHQTEINSADPQETLQQCCNFLQRHKPYDALGVAMFGPVGLDANRTETYGKVLGACPKAAWRNVNVLEPLRDACSDDVDGDELPTVFETDVNAPALAEYASVVSSNDKRNRSNNIQSLAYITVGTGVGVGLVVNGQAVHGRVHPEGGHVAVQPLPGDDFGGYSWGGQAPYHGRNTVEGLACSVSLLERMHANGRKDIVSLKDVEDDDAIWDHCANAIANCCVNLLLLLSVEKIVLGGGIMQRRGLIDRIRKRTVVLINGYVELPVDMASLIFTSEHGEDAGLIGAIELAKQAYSGGQEAKDTRAKQTAFQIGLWSGALAGGILTACFYTLVRSIRSTSNRRS
jgi:fructokinase